MERKLKHSIGALKQEKVDLITIDIAREIIQTRSLQVLDESDQSDDDVDDDDGVLEEIGENDSDDDDDDDGNDNDEESEPVLGNLLHTTRSGRTCRTWRGRSRAADFSL